MKMKKVLGLALAAALTLSLAACGGNSGNSGNTSQPASGGSSTSQPASGGDASTPAPSTGGGLITVGIINNDPNESGYR